jgi:hypothetical protein
MQGFQKAIVIVIQGGLAFHHAPIVSTYAGCNCKNTWAHNDCGCT